MSSDSDTTLFVFVASFGFLLYQCLRNLQYSRPKSIGSGRPLPIDLALRHASKKDKGNHI
jgi:hypothetical protein